MKLMMGVIGIGIRKIISYDFMMINVIDFMVIYNNNLVNAFNIC